jgi:hypothetical protein
LSGSVYNTSASRLVGDEKTSTPKGPLPKPLHQRRQEQTPVNTASLEPIKGNPEKPIRRYQPGYPGEKPAGKELVGYKPSSVRGGKTPVFRPYYETPLDKRSGYGRAVDRQVTPVLATGSKVASRAITVPATIAGNVLAQAGGGPAALATLKAARRGHAGAATIEAASLLPLGRLGRILKGVKEGTVAAESLNAASKIPEEASILRGTIRGAKVARGKQEAGYSVERGKRFAAAAEHLNNSALEPAERLQRAKHELKGELPKINFGGFHELNDESLKALQTHVLDHPTLLPGQKIRAAEALSGALAGRVPTRGEIKLLEHVFGKMTVRGVTDLAKHPLRENILRVANIPRSLMASYDVSAPMRQGLVAFTRHPVISSRNLGPMFKALKSEDYFQNQILGDIESRPNYPLYHEMKLAITKLGTDVGEREERFPTDLAEHIPVVGRGVRGSGRAYNGFLDKTRADIADHLLARAHAHGVDIHNDKFLHGLGSLINNSTGRGDLGTGAIHEAGKFLNAFFFSPRLLASRVNIIAAPLKYARADPFVRKEALKTWLSLAGTLTTVLGLMSRIPGVHVEMDPRNPDWGKVRHGNTRIDLAGGFQQPLRLAAQLYTGTAISSTTGKKLNLTAGGFGQPNRLDIFLRFFEGKESPIASLGTDWLRNSNQVGQKFSWKSEVGQRVIPLLAQDAYGLYSDRKGGVDGISAAFLGYGIGSVGFGLQTYAPRKPKTKSGGKPVSYDSSGTSSGGYDTSSSSGSAYNTSR